MTAIKAAQLGKKVILLEKAGRVGGNTDIAHGFFPRLFQGPRRAGHRGRPGGSGAGYGGAHRRCDRRRYHAHRYLRLLRVFDWLLDFPHTREYYTVEKLGDKREAGPIYGPAVTHFVRRIENVRSLDPSIGPGWAGTFIKQTMLDAIPAQKLNVEILLQHEAKHLITDESGRVTGVVALDPGGETEIRCQAVVLATGGFGSSDEKLQKYAGFFDVDRPVTRFSVPSDTGDAIDMLQELGVEPDPERLFVSFFGPAHHPYSYSLYRLIEEPSNLSVDLNGVRWQDESGGLFTGMKNITGHPKECTWNIFTQKNVDDIFRRFLSDPSLADEIECYEHYQEDLDREAEYKIPPVVKADTVEELALKLDMDPAVLIRTVTNYNRWCRQGQDEEFGKAAEHLIPRDVGPFYAVYAQRFSEAAMGGLMVNAEVPGAAQRRHCDPRAVRRGGCHLGHAPPGKSSQ